MLKTTVFLLSLILLTSCSMYSSAGRKQFEEKAQNAIQAFSLQNCRELSAAETWLKEEFPNGSQELVEIHPDYEVWRETMRDDHVQITVFSKNNLNNIATTTESCLYKFESTPIWLTYKKSFLDELSRRLIPLD
jgi:hypothetical protein